MNEMKKTCLYVDVRDDVGLVTTPNDINKDFIQKELSNFEIELTFFKKLFE
ncbi:MAG: hypothetical protein KJ655_05735 [Candidatus Thermoplasmatota archaeon]|nr:hypothetical protein [Candidatus Thermoplasmatota archaeon]